MSQDSFDLSQSYASVASVFLVVVMNLRQASGCDTVSDGISLETDTARGEHPMSQWLLEYLLKAELQAHQNLIHFHNLLRMQTWDEWSCVSLDKMRQ